MSSFFTKTNTLLDTIVPQYLAACQNVLDSTVISSLLKGKFENIKYTTEGYDTSDLSHDEKLKIVGLLYSEDCLRNNESAARYRLENVIVQTRDRLGADKSYKDLLPKLPKGVFDSERIQHLSRDELENEFKLNLADLEKLKSMMDTPDSKIQVLEEKNNVLETILYNAGDGVFTLDMHGVIVTFNRAMEELTGFSSEEAVGKTADEIVKLHDDTAPITATRYNPSLDNSTGQKVYSNNKVTLEGRDGVKKSVKIMSSTLPLTTGNSVGCIVTLSDMSKESQLETMKLDFVSIAAHELRTPLTSIRGYLTLLNSEAKDTLPPNQHDYLKKIMVASDQLYILVENLLNISRIERGNLILQKNSEDWLVIVNAILDNFKGVATESEVTLNFIKPAVPIPRVSVDKVMIMEVLSNLIDNAIKYNKAGGRVSIVLEYVGSEVVTHVKDTGSGIPEESTPHLFKKFYRTSSSVWRQGKKGTGLGLFISHEIVKLHGGRIWFESRLNEGSTFSFSIPAVAEVTT